MIECSVAKMEVSLADGMNQRLIIPIIYIRFWKYNYKHSTSI